MNRTLCLMRRQKVINKTYRLQEVLRVSEHLRY